MNGVPVVLNLIRTRHKFMNEVVITLQTGIVEFELTSIHTLINIKKYIY